MAQAAESRAILHGVRDARAMRGEAAHRSSIGFGMALEAFGAAGEPGRDALLDYYRALACYDTRLFLCADWILAALGERSGPRIAEQARKLRANIAAALAQEPAQEAVDWYLGRCSAGADAHRPVLAAAYCREAAGLADRRKDRYRRGDALATLATLEGAPRGTRR